MLLYLATPYSHPELAVMQSRFESACDAAAKLMNLGYEVFCPIAHSHPIADYLDPSLRTSFDFWMRQDKAVLKHCDALIVYQMDGWNTSRGVMAEIAFALTNGIKVYYVKEGNMNDVIDTMLQHNEEQNDLGGYEDFLDLEDAAGDAVIAALKEAA